MKRLLISLLLLPVTAFATITVTDRGTGTDNTSSTNVVISGSVLSGTMTAGNTVTVCLAMDNANSAGANISATSFTDNCSPPNTWYVRSDTATAGTANLTQELAILTSNLVTNFTTSNSFTVTLTVASTAEAWTFTEASTNASGAAVVYENSAVGNTTNTTTPSISANFTPSTGDLAIGCGATEGTDTWVGDTVNTAGGSYSTKQSTGIGATTSAMSVISQWKVVSAYGTGQTFAPTLGTTGDTRVGWVILTEADAKVRSIGGNTTSSTTITVPVNLPLATGSFAVLCLAADNAGAASVNIPSTPTDTGGNTWTRQTNGVYNVSGASTGVESAIFTAPITTGLAVGNSITLATAATSIPAKTWTLWEFAPAGVGSVTYVSGATSTGATTTTPGILTSSSMINGNYIIAMIGAEGLNTFTADTDTTNGTWKTPATAGIGVSASVGMTLMSQWKLVTATGTQNFNSTITSADTISSWIQINDSTPTGPTAQQKAAFFQLFP